MLSNMLFFDILNIILLSNAQFIDVLFNFIILSLVLFFDVL